MSQRALVLGSGGITGIAWSLGLLAGLAEAGIDLSTADLIVGTSAGSGVGAHLASRGDLEQLYATQLEDPAAELAGRVGMRNTMRMVWAAIRPGDSAKARAGVGRMALAAHTVSEAERRSVITAKLKVHDWPESRLLIASVDAVNGEFVAFDRDSGVPLVDAIAASCAVPGVWPPVTINGRRWIDGGIRSVTNTDLAAGYERLVVIAPIAIGLGSHVKTLRRATRAAAISPDRAARRAIGRNTLDPSHRPDAARAGRAQAAKLSSAIAAVWVDDAS